MRRVFAGLLLCSGSYRCLAAPGAASSIIIGRSMPAAQHGGNMLALPGGKGFAELLIERGPGGQGGGCRQLRGSWPTSTNRTARRLWLTAFERCEGPSGGSRRAVKDVKLTPQTTPAGQFASEPGQYAEDLRGQIELTLGASAVQASFLFR